MANDSNLWALRAPKPLNKALNDFKEKDVRNRSNTLEYLLTLGLKAHKAKINKQEKKK
jgi:hypothetical protein